MTQDRFNLEQPPRLPNADAQAIVDALWAYGRTLSHPERTYAIELRQWQQRYAQARGVIDLIAEMNQALGLQALLERLAQGVSRFFAGDGVGIFLGNGGGLRLTVAVAEQFPAQLAGSDEWVAGVFTGQVRQVQMGHPRHSRPALATRLADARGNPIGVLILAPTKRADYTAEEIAFLQTVVGYAALAIQNALAYDQTDALSRIDALTGLFNRREFDRLLAQEFARATRYARFLSLIMVDIDHFKKINDQRGHPAGDWALQKVGELMRATRLRSSDGAFRLGGEEFAVMLTETDKAGALAYAERLRQTAEKMQIFADGAGLTISLGVATFPEDAREPAQLVARADKALYEAKHTGRNVVVPA
jgi:diguanylate cyclase (GGDEF)-like protein